MKQNTKNGIYIEIGIHNLTINKHNNNNNNSKFTKLNTDIQNIKPYKNDKQ
jgi:hypothetical protein